MTIIHDTILCGSGSCLYGESTNNNCYRIILSLVTFAQRHLRLTELLEAVGAVRLTAGQNLRKSAIPSAEFVDRCEPLIKRTPLHENSDEELVTITHSIAHRFLLSRSDLSIIDDADAVMTSLPRENPPSLRISSIADACLNYLSQPRYSQLLKKRTASQFEVGEFEISQQKLLSYAAKFWSIHFELHEGSEELFQRIFQFIIAPNYVTAIQVQSLFVQGHFIQSLDISGKGPRRSGQGGLQKEMRARSYWATTTQ